MGQSVSLENSSLFRDLQWNAQIGKVFQSIGTPFFHEELIDLLEITVETDAFWIIRYSEAAAPDVIFTRDVSVNTGRTYSRHCAQIDPFSANWKKLREAGVITLATLQKIDPACTFYSEIFLRAADMDDELGIILPITEENCFAIFLERKHGLFTDDEVQILRTLYPAIEGCCRSHLGWLFNDVDKTEASTSSLSFQRPTAIFDHAGHHVYSDAGWNQAAHRFPTLKREAAKLALDGSREFVLEDWVLRAQRLTPDFSLAPNGAMLVLERAEVAMLSNNAGASPDVFSKFTRREREVLQLVLEGLRSKDISGKLGIGIGSVRNIKLRLYRKSGVFSEGELASKLIAYRSLL